MSSTNRGYERHKTDYYVTPIDAVKIFLNSWTKDIGGGPKILNDLKWLDPCAGGDSKHQMTYPIVIKEMVNPKVLDTIDIRKDSLAQRKEDYLLADTKGYDIIITNPPFYSALSIIEKALEDVGIGGYVVMLLRLNFFGSNQRFKFFQKQLPVWAYVHHHRFSFTDDGKTDSIEYMHAVWVRGVDPEYTKLKVI